MSEITGKTERTLVKVFISIFAVASAFSSVTRAQVVSVTAPDPCKEATDNYVRAHEKIADACKKAKLGDDCASKARSCDEVSTEESFNTMDAFAIALGLPPGSGGKVGSACPQANGRDYFTEKEKIQRELKDTQKELAELNDDKADIQDAYNKEMRDIQEELTKAQENYKKRSREIDQENRERIAEFNNTQNQAKDELRKKGAEILRLRGQLIQSQRDKALKLIAMTEASGKRACMKAVNEAKKAYLGVSASTSSNHIAQAKAKKQELINIYNDCMDAFDQQRIALNESKKQEQEELNQQIADAQASMDEIQNSLSLASSQLEEIKQAADKEKADELQSVIDLGTRGQERMQAAYTKMQENLKTMAQKSANLQGDLNRANQDLMALGPAPKRGSEYTPEEASSDISSQIKILDAIANDARLEKCPDLKKLANESSTKYRGSSRRTRSTR